jgi:uncharacterized protein
MNQNVLITGASSGIGYELAKVFAKNHYNLILVARNTETMQDLKEKYPKVDIKIIKQDLSNDDACSIIFEKLKDVQVDILVNNAGFGDTGEFQDLKLKKQLNMIDLNVRALTELTHIFGSKMVKNNSGKILNVASIVSFMPGPRMATYYATKAYVLSFGQALRQEWGRYGVEVCTLCPGATKSGFQGVANQNDLEFAKASNIPTSKSVAEYGYKMLMDNKSIGVPGFTNKIFAFLPKILPRKIGLMIIENIQKK